MKRTKAMIGSANSIYMPYTIVMLHPVRKGKPAECKNLASLKDKMPIDGKTDRLPVPERQLPQTDQ